MTLTQARRLEALLVALEYKNEVLKEDCDSGCQVPACPMCWQTEGREHNKDCPFPLALITIKAEIRRMEVGAGLRGTFSPGGLQPSANANWR